MNWIKLLKLALMLIPGSFALFGLYSSANSFDFYFCGMLLLSIQVVIILAVMEDWEK